ncbi:hypothetical protein [Aureimonas pseudogalii]|nr:hypothetical protein [Aureimonas pseudogalii]
MVRKIQAFLARLNLCALRRVPIRPGSLHMKNSALFLSMMIASVTSATASMASEVHISQVGQYESVRAAVISQVGNRQAKAGARASMIDDYSARAYQVASNDEPSSSDPASDRNVISMTRIGTGHTATLRQEGQSNIILLTQTGTNQSVEGFQSGSENFAEISQGQSDNHASFTQSGTGNHAVIVQN